MLSLQPVTRDEAMEFVAALHRTHGRPQGYRFALGVADGEKLVGVIMVGRPVARHLQDGWTAEVLRCCTDGTKNACSKLYSAAWRAARAMGYRKLITYTLPEEGGASLRGAGWTVVAQTKAETWGRRARPRDDQAKQQKLRWEIAD